VRPLVLGVCMPLHACRKEGLMDETRRFLRYVVPTLVFLAEVALLLLVTQKDCLISA